MTSLVIVLAILLVIALIGLGIHNGIIKRYNRVQRAWSDVLTYERQKAKILPALQAQAASFKDYESTLLTKVTALRAAVDTLPNAADGNSLHPVRTGTRDLMSTLAIAVEAYPTLTAVNTVSSLMAEITNQEENVGAAIVIFNRCVEDFNNSLQMFPNSAINEKFTHKKVVAPFKDGHAESQFEYKFDPQP
jgi:LemA protein